MGEAPIRAARVSLAVFIAVFAALATASGTAHPLGTSGNVCISGENCGGCPQCSGGDGALGPAYPATYHWEGTTSEGCSTETNYAGPTEDESNGYVYISVGSVSALCGGGSILSEGGFYTGDFAPTANGEFSLSVVWGGAYENEMCSALGADGTSLAQGYLDLYFNVYDITASAWVFSSYQTYTVFNFGDVVDGVCWGWNSDDVYATFGSTGYLNAGQDYQFMSYESVYCLTEAVGFVDATCATNAGTGAYNGLVFQEATWAWLEA